MNEGAIIHARLLNQLLLNNEKRSVQEVVSHLGALQAQDYEMMKWAIGCRIPNSTEAMIESVLEKGDLLRTHVLRPTWHVVSSKDIHWMLELTAPQIRIRMKSRDAQLGLSASIIHAGKNILVKALEDGIHKTKDTLSSILKQAAIPTDQYRDAHILMHAELDGLICSGRNIGNKRTYALLEERAPYKQLLLKEEALARLARIYFSSRCPATVSDFVWWSGLTIRDARNAVELIKSDFLTKSIGGQTFLFPNEASFPLHDKVDVHVIPSFDEYLIAYKDRSAALIPDRFTKVVSNNGIFRPILLLNGRVIGTWKRSFNKSDVFIEVLPFEFLDLSIKIKIKKSFDSYGVFVGKTTTIHFMDF